MGLQYRPINFGSQFARDCGARLFGRHHTTAIHACRATQRHLENDPTLRSDTGMAAADYAEHKGHTVVAALLRSHHPSSAAVVAMLTQINPLPGPEIEPAIANGNREAEVQE